MLNVGKDLIRCKCLVTPSGIKFNILNINQICEKVFQIGKFFFNSVSDKFLLFTNYKLNKRKIHKSLKLIIYLLILITFYAALLFLLYCLRP